MRLEHADPARYRRTELAEGLRVLGTDRRGKYLLLALEGGLEAVVHLGMTGGFRFAAHPHTRLTLHTPAGPVYFVDPRRFGSIDLVASGAEDAHRLLAGLGPEPLDPAFSGASLLASLAGRRTPIKAALLDQRIVTGLGNIYVSEALHRAGIDPRRLAGRIGAARIAALVGHIRDVLDEAIAAGGSSLRDHRQASGELGYFQHSFRVYDREDAPCPRPACPGTIRRIVQSGRSSFYCPACQR